MLFLNFEKPFAPSRREKSELLLFWFGSLLKLLSVTIFYLNVEDGPTSHAVNLIIALFSSTQDKVTVKFNR